MSDSPGSPSTRQPSAPVELEALLGGRGLQAVGLVSLFLSAAFFFKLAVDHGWLPPAVRVLIGLVTGAALLVTGVLMHRRPDANRAIIEGLIGLGGALCYLSLWAAGPLFGLVQPAVAFGAMSAVTCVLTVLAARHRSQLTALYGVIGGLLTPAFLPHTGQQIILGAYLLALCAGMLKLAEDKRFHLVPGVAFLGSLAYVPQFAIDANAGWTYIQAGVLASLFFLEFGIARLLTARREETTSRLNVVLGALNVAAYIGILELDLANYHVTLAAVLLVLCVALGWAGCKTRGGFAIESVYLWGATAALSLAIPAYFADKYWAMAAACTVEGLLLYTLGTFRTRKDLRFTGLLMAAAAAVLGVMSICMQPVSIELFVDRLEAFGAIALALFGIAAIARAKNDVFHEMADTNIADLAVTLANLVAVIGIGNILYTLPDSFNVSYSVQHLLMSVAWTVYAAAIFAVALLRGSRLLRWQSLMLFAVTIVKVVTIDLASIELIDRVGVCFGLGVVTLIVSAIYLRRSHAAAQAVQGEVQ